MSVWVPVTGRASGIPYRRLADAHNDHVVERTIAREAAFGSSQYERSNFIAIAAAIRYMQASA